MKRGTIKAFRLWLNATFTGTTHRERAAVALDDIERVLKGATAC